MKKVELVMRQGDVYIYEVDEFPTGERVQDKATKEHTLAYGELSGHSHRFEDTAAVDLFKIPEYPGVTFVETKKDTSLTHGFIKGFKGREADQDYHSELEFKGGKKYITGIVEETDWLTKTVRRVID
jgi:hypothetical protein